MKNLSHILYLPARFTIRWVTTLQDGVKIPGAQKTKWSRKDFSSADLWSVLYIFIVNTPMSSLTKSVWNCFDPIYW